MKPRVDTYQLITDRVIEILNKGEIPWRKPWKGDADAPRNYMSKKAYRGINAFMLSCTGFTSPWFVTYKQAKMLGGKIIKEEYEKGFPVVYWNMFEKKNAETDEKTTIPFIKHSIVYNLDQTEGIEVDEIDEAQIEFEPLKDAEEIVKNFIGKPEIQFKGQRACYSPNMDIVNMPKPETFNNNNFYYSVLFHELVHSTGAKQRLNRDGITDSHFFGSPNYSKEELVAEFGAMFLSAECGIDNEKTFETSGAYIQGWLKKLRNDNKLIVSAASKARKASDYILGKERPKPVTA